ncbi:hypothetical protein [Chitinophaga agri]|uniref:Uncharacterized protein n=1 Tax=Chitinophaga agri TaxID=2703787 RepID=A0A6B9Z9Q3_9BACT|nr:hypothetical protein [Chitinophaga agri]QHS58787.1 hypothetical protein GWR21_03960 [Chitinophaga agri]
MNITNILNYMNTDKERVWYPLAELASKAEADPLEVMKALNASPQVVRSARLSKEGDQLFASKEDFSRSEPLMNQIIGAFKNRID